MTIKLQAKFITKAFNHTERSKQAVLIQKDQIVEVLEIVYLTKYNVHGSEINGREPWAVIMLEGERMDVFPQHFSKYTEPTPQEAKE
jgi:hypothetical protein